jgi:hypothetical protein
MFTDQLSLQLGDPQRNPAATVADTLRRLRRQVVAWLAIYTFAAVGMITVCAAITLVWFNQWLKTLPVGVEPTLARLMTDRPEILAVSCLGGAIGVFLAVGGMLGWRYSLGSENSPPKKVVLMLGGMPVALGCLGALLTFAKLGSLYVVAVPVLLGGSIAMVPFVVGLMALGILQLMLNLLGQAPLACGADELPPDVARYFDQFNAAARGAGLDFAGDFCFIPKRTKFCRAWIAPHGAYFVDATHLSVGNTVIRALSVSSATDDGHFFTTTDLSQPVPTNRGGLEHCLAVPGASLAELIERHINLVGNWVEKSGSRPLVFDAADQHELFAYGLAAHLQQESDTMLWLGNPYKNQPLPPLPGRTWQEDAIPWDALPAL